MQKWHLTAGLTGLVLLAAVVGPRLVGKRGDEAPPPPLPPQPPVPTDVIDVPPPPEVGPTPSGHLILDAGLDRTALMAGQSNERYIAITVTAPADIGDAVRRPLDVAVVMDVSGSMSARGKIDYAKRSAKYLASNMQSGDLYSLVTFNDDARVVIPPTSVDDPLVIHRAIDRIMEGGGTNIFAGVTEGGEQIEDSLTDGHVGRVILISDGIPSVGIQDEDSLERLAAKLGGQGITVSTIGMGVEFNEDLLQGMADMGGGSYHFVDDPRDLEAAFTEELERSMSVVARGTQVRIALPPGVAGVDVIGWDAESFVTDTADRSDGFDHGWTVNVGEVKAGETRKIVCKVRIDDPTGVELDVAKVTATYHDIVDDAPGLAIDEVGATVTHDRVTVERSLDKPAAQIAARAQGNEYLDRAAREYQAGNATKADEIAAQGQSYLEQNAVELDDDTLAADAEVVEKQRGNYKTHAPTSVEGRRAVIESKEAYYDNAR